MDELLTMLISGAPNLIVSLVGLWWLARKVDKQDKLIWTLLEDRLANAEDERSEDEASASRISLE
jgi:hypothetical protein